MSDGEGAADDFGADDVADDFEYEDGDGVVSDDDGDPTGAPSTAARVLPGKADDDDDDDKSASDGEPSDGEPDDEEAIMAGSKAMPQKARVNEIIRGSNRSLQTHVVKPDERVTDNRLHKSEAARIIAMRAEQIAQNATMFTDATGLHDPVMIAYQELLDLRCPLILRRRVGTTPSGDPIVEEWNTREMVLPQITIRGHGIAK